MPETISIVPVPAGKEMSVEKVGIDGLRRQIQDFEVHYALDTPEFSLPPLDKNTTLDYYLTQ